MIATYVSALEYIDSLARRASRKQVKDREFEDVSYRLVTSRPKPVLSINLPNNMVDLVFHERGIQMKKVPQSRGKTTTKADKRASRSTSQKVTPKDHKDKTSKKQKTIKTVNETAATFDVVPGEIIHAIRQDYHTSTSQIKPKPVFVTGEKIEYFKVTNNGHEHLRSRVDSANAMVGINGHSVDYENSVRTCSEQSKHSEKRIPLSWEDQLSNFPEEVKTVRQKYSGDNSSTKNFPDNYRIYPKLPSTTLVWRPLVKPSRNSSNHVPNSKLLGPPPEQLLPSSPSFIKGTPLRKCLTHRYLSLENLTETGTSSKHQYKVDLGNNKTLVERAIAAKDEIVFKSFQISINQSKDSKIKVSNHDAQDNVRSRKTVLEKRQKSNILSVANTKHLPRDPNLTGEYFHVRKMDIGIPPSDEKKTRKPDDSLGNHPAPPNDQEQSKSRSSPEKETRRLEISKETFQVTAFAKPMSVKTGGVDVATQVPLKGNIPAKKPPVINFRIPHSGYVCETPDSRGDCQETEIGSQETIAETPTEKKIPDEEDQNRRDFTGDRARTV